MNQFKMARIVVLSFALIIINASLTLGQSISAGTEVDLGYQNFIPPSPTSSELGKYGQIPVSLASGTPNIDVPIYTFSTQHLSVPISLSYYSTGVKVDQVASWVGMGWSLNAGGVITRIVRDNNDLDLTSANRGKPFPVNLQTNNVWGMDYIQSSLYPAWDTEQDLFSFNFLGRTGQFVWDSTDVARVMPYQNIRVERSITPTERVIYITDEQGIKYSFTATENTQVVGLHMGISPITSWFLTKIEHPTGEVIHIEYLADDNYSYITGKTERYDYNIDSGSGCVTCTQKNSYGVSTSMLNVGGVRLHRIWSEGYGEIIFNATADRLDLVPSYRLRNIQVFDPYGNLLNTYQLKTNFTSTQRLYLDTLLIKDSNDINTKEYYFDYEDREALPERFSYAQDYWGYYNGVLNNQHFIPDDASVISDGGDRNVYSAFTKKGILTKITYPTGGYNSFEYENNSYYGSRTIHGPSATFTLNCTGSSSSDITQTGSFTAYESMNIHFWTDAAPDPSDPTVKGQFSTIEVKNSLNEVVFSQSFAPDNSISQNINIPIGGDIYTISILSHGDIASGNVSIHYYSTAPTSYPDNIETGGLRIKRVKSYDPVTGKEELKRYYYGSIKTPTISSAYQSPPPKYSDEYGVQLVCEGFVPNPDNPLQVTPTSICRYGVDYSTNQYSLFNLTEPVTYKYVTVSYGENFENGGEEHHFIIDQNSGSSTINGNIIIGTPTSNSGWQNKLEDTVKLFKMDAGNPVILKKVYNEYVQDEYNKVQVPSLVSRLSYTPTDGNFTASTYICTDADIQDMYYWKCTANHIHIWDKTFDQFGNINNICIAPGNNLQRIFVQTSCSGKSSGDPVDYYYNIEDIDAELYLYFSIWHYLKSTTTITYDENGENPISNTVTYDYDNPVHAQLTHTGTTNSQGQNVDSYIYYPDDYINIDNLGTIKDKHIVNIPIKSEQTIDGSQVSGQVLKYSDNGLPTQAYQYEVINSKARVTHSTSTYIPSSDYKLKTTLEYGSNNLVREVNSTDGVPHAYIWGYDNTKLIAHIVNASDNQVAYSGFEGIGLGNWVIEGTQTKTITLSSTNKIETFKNYKTQTINYNCTMTVNNGATLELRFMEAGGTVISELISASPYSNSISLPPGDWTSMIIDGKDIIVSDLSFDIEVVDENNVPVSTDSKLGQSSLDIAQVVRILKNGLTPGVYNLFYWVKGGSISIAGTATIGTEEVVKTDGNGWSLVKRSVTINDSTDEIIITGTGLVDELKIYPVGAQITTYTYLPGIGISTITDTNNNTSSYEYDDFGRLSYIKDSDGKITDQYDYHYYNN